MTFSQFLIILKARWKAGLIVFGLIVLIVLAISLIMPSKYKASAAVLIDVKSPDPVAGMVLPGMMTAGYIATQLDVIQSERVARGAIRLLRLGENAALREQWQDQTKGVGSFETWLSKLLERGLDIKPSRESSVISISYEAVDPNFAAAMANAYVQSYIDTTRDLRIEPATQYGNIFEIQAKKLREKLEEAQTSLSNYQRENGLIATDERLDVETARLNELSSQVVGLQSLSAESSSRRAQSSANSPEVLNNMVVSTLKSDLARQEARLKELSSRYGNSHPQVTELQANIDEIRSNIANETSRVNSSLGINSTVNKSRESELRAALEAQRQKLLKIKEQRDAASVLLRDVESAQRAYESMTLRLNQSMMESQSTQTNVSVIQAATPPSEASSPRPILNSILAVLIGGILALATMLGKELRDRRLRTDEDVVDGLDTFMLGTMPANSDLQKKFGRGSRSPLLPKRALPELSAPGL